MTTKSRNSEYEGLPSTIDAVSCLWGRLIRIGTTEKGKSWRGAPDSAGVPGMDWGISTRELSLGQVEC